MGVTELRQKPTAELKQVLGDLLRQEFKLRLVKATGELKRNHQFKQLRREIARVKTLLTEKEGE